MKYELKLGVWCVVLAVVLAGCGQSYEETKRITRAQRLEMWRKDSAALKVAVMPTLDCLPILLAKDHQLFDTVVDIRLKHYTAQMDVDTALQRGRVELGVSDLVRTELMKNQGTELDYLTSTNAYWQLITNRQARITQLKHLDDKMLAMTRHSVTDLLSDLATDSAKLKTEQVFRIQVNDVLVRLKMLENNEMDALLMTEPQAMQARQMKHRVLLDTRKLDMNMGVIAMRTKDMDKGERKRQMEVFRKGYNEACDSLNEKGVAHYNDLLTKYFGLKSRQADSTINHLKFNHIEAPREQDINRAKQFITLRRIR